MATYYIIDTTDRQNGKSPVLLFQTTAGVVKHLEKMCMRRFRKTRTQYMVDSNALGFGDDDAEGVNFTEQMEQYFDMGVIRADSNPIKCNIFKARQFAKGKTEHGD